MTRKAQIVCVDYNVLKIAVNGPFNVQISRKIPKCMYCQYYVFVDGWLAIHKYSKYHSLTTAKGKLEHI